MTEAPVLSVVWDPDVLTRREYAELIITLGDLVRAAGGVGVVRIAEELTEVPHENS